MARIPKKSGKSYDRFMPPSDRERMQAIQRQAIARVGDEDLTLEKKIKEILTNDPFVFVEDISVKVKKGKVELSGVVDSPAHRERVETIVSQIPGIQDLRNNLTVGEVRSIPEKALLDLISKAIENARISAKEVGISVKAGVLSLSGRIPTLRDKIQILRIISAIPGIKSISDHLAVGFEEIPDGITLKNKVTLAISELPSLKVRDLKVRVSKGTVYLKGEVDIVSDKLPLIDKVASVTGVKEIVDEIAHEKEESSTTQLRKKIETSFSKDSRLNGTRINFEISGGTIFLQGNVQSYRQLYVIEEILSGFPEIKRVVNELTVLS